MGVFPFLIVCAVIVFILGALISSFRTSKDPEAPSRSRQVLALLAVLCVCSVLSYGAWWKSTQGAGLSQDLAATVSGQHNSGAVVGTSVRQGSRRGRLHRGRGLHGGK